jgi:two-component system, chemotaxis family, protein-glutamate methylesterase/glutaminase
MAAEQAELHAGPTNRETRVVVVGASAGGVEATTSLVRALPADLDPPVLVVVHMPRGGSSRLAEIVGRAGPLPATQARDGERLRGGHVYVAPPDLHLTVSAGRIHVLDGPLENRFRPAIDQLFRSAARTLGGRAIGVILSGTLDDGAAGMAAIKAAGGVAFVQDPDDAICGGLPRAVLEAVEPDLVGTVHEIARAIVELAAIPVPGMASGAPADDHPLLADPMVLPAHGADMSCPDCGGALQSIDARAIVRYRCRVGHVYSPESLLDGKAQDLEAALWAAARTLEETAAISGKLAERSRRAGATSAARRFEARQADAARRADVVRQAIESFDDGLAASTEAALGADPGRGREPVGATRS